MIPTWTVLAIPVGLFLATWAAVDGARTLRRRARDRAYAADVARRVRARNAEIELLKQLYAMESAGERP